MKRIEKELENLMKVVAKAEGNQTYADAVKEYILAKKFIHAAWYLGAIYHEYNGPANPIRLAANSLHTMLTMYEEENDND